MTSSWQMGLPLWLKMIQMKGVLLYLRNVRDGMLTWLVMQRDLMASEQEAEESGDHLPATPVMMPGAYSAGLDHLSMLPPPLLDDDGSDPRSFEGLLGVRRMREQQQRKQYYEKLLKRNRPAHRVGTLTAFVNFVRSAKASQARRSRPPLPRRRFTSTLDPNTRRWGKRPSKPQGTSDRPSGAASAALSPALASTVSAEQEEPSGYASDTDASFDTMVWPRRDHGPMEALDLATSASGLETAATATAFGTPLWGTESSSNKKRLTPQEMLSRYSSTHTSPMNSTGSIKPSPSSGRLLSAHDETTLSYMWVAISFVFVAVTFVPDFIVFLLAHLLDIMLDAIEVVMYTLWLLRWIWQNVTGQTILGRIFYEAYHLIHREWEYVVREDHEDVGDRYRRLFGVRLYAHPRGLNTFQVLRGLLELACIQTVTRQQFEEEGAGLVKLANWRRPSQHPPTPMAPSLPTTPAVPVFESDSDNDSDNDDEDLVVTNRSSDILELARNSRRKSAVSSSTAKPHHDYSYSLWHENNAAMVRNIKWASQLAMSTYGLRVHIVDLPPVFTPSGRELPKQTFAHLTRLEAQDVLHADIQNLDIEATYLPTFYIVRDMRRKVVCVAVRGTQSFADIVVDLDMRTEDVTSSLAEWRGIEPQQDSESFAFHAGIWRASQRLVQPGTTLFDKLRDALEEHQDFDVVFVGHSLGAAIASAAVIQLSEYHVEDTGPEADPRKGVWRTSSQNGFPGGRRIRAITFAHPSTLSYNLSKRVSYGAVPLVVNVTYGTDIIPRCGHGQVRELRRVLGALARVRRRQGMVSRTISSNTSAAVADDEVRLHVLRRFWDWCSIVRHKAPDSVMRTRKKLLESQFWRLRCEIENDLYVQARRRFENARDQEALASQTPISPWLAGTMSLYTLSGRRQRLDYATLKSESAHGGVLIPGGRSLWLSTRGELYDVMNPMAFFSLPDFHLAMFTDHFPAAYEEAILALGHTSTSDK